MRATYSFFTALAIAVSMTACSAGSDSAIEDLSGTTTSKSASTVSISTLKSTYGAETTTTVAADSVPGITSEKAAGILDALKANNNIAKSNAIENDNSISKDTRKVIMNEDYSATSRSGSENFTLSVVLNFTMENSTLYYWGTDYKYTGNSFKWYSSNMSLTSVKGSKDSFEFTSSGYLYFKISDQGNTVLRVPVSFKGTHNFNTNEGTFSFQLVNCSK